MFIGYPDVFGGFFEVTFDPKRTRGKFSKQDAKALKQIALEFFCQFAICDHRDLPKEWIWALWPLGSFHTKDGKRKLRSQRAVQVELNHRNGVEFRPRQDQLKVVYAFVNKH
ncbi:MAG: hypothetical protein COU85_00905 [Candidatus Portnoybacteria bacterium CG10_big_fil_rev_8_21_14_0_10_44_7]|uniref:Uncharacterized protein n=1 Tax=Candidatus Portnoybacteria bacterium CG10_big_fil_rev_8_21_14_0_10_44_7 TaxID=1974816 RepID=A0A2M8KJ73_9BACT|nr:MAG: hypothetical protein COU85_00905 [Candidatus Portnoybacteria bacterium CG10_big_fil_rev_8_21_14_0_10_44_7]